MSLFSQIPFEQTPDFETSSSGHYATGLGIADINGDGWKDIVVSNGNDMSRQRLVVYYNQGDGTFPLVPNWQSDDIDYHGHLAAADIDNDGDVDVAVSVYLGPGGFGSLGKVKIYYNNGSELEGTPSYQTQYFYSFSCALGDADADGDLDLAVACGEPYSSTYDFGRIFYNDNGSFGPLADWESDVQMGALDVEFADVDHNGFLDLIYVCETIDNYVFLADMQGNIDENWDWVSDHPSNFMNSVDVGKSRVNGPTCIAITGNDQLGGDGKIKQFTFIDPVPQSSPPTWESDHIGYGSGILMADINHDEYIDLLYGSWWGPLSILEGCCDEWTNPAVYTATTTSVVESILMSDLGKFNYTSGSKTIKALTEQGILLLDQQIIEKINAVYVNSVLLERTEYCYVELKNWVSFKDHIMPGDVVTIEYEYMYDGDIVISNWDPGRGNFIYYNTNNPVGIAENQQEKVGVNIISLSPVPATTHINLQVMNDNNSIISMNITDLSGRIVVSQQLGIINQTTTVFNIELNHLKDGVYILDLSDGKSSEKTKFLIRR